MEEVNVYQTYTSSGCIFLITTHQIIYELGSFSKIENNKANIPLCDITQLQKNPGKLSNSLVIHTCNSQTFKFKFKKKKTLYVVFDLILYRTEETKNSIKEGLSYAVNQLQIPSFDIIFQEQVGIGSYGNVFKGSWNGMTVAIKSVKLKSIKETQSFQREIACLASLRHPSCIQLFGITHQEANPEQLSIVMEYCDEGSLFDAINSQKSFLYRWDYILRLLYDISRGMQYVHGRGIIHRDIKPDNIMICSSIFPVDEDSSIAKIVDFGISKFLSHSGIPQTVCGTPGNFAPEIFTHDYDFFSDVFGFGVLMYKTIFKVEPFPNIVTVNDYKRMIDKKYIIKSIFPIPLLVEDILMRCLSYDPEGRPTFKEISHFLRNCMLHYQTNHKSFPNIPGGIEEDYEYNQGYIKDILTPVTNPQLKPQFNEGEYSVSPIIFPKDDEGNI